MKVLVVGNGGREHALVWKLLQSKQIEQVICVPGNGGTANMENCQNVPLAVDDFEGINQLAQNNGITLVVVGPEVPLAKGITDYLQDKGLKVFGPTKAGARIESSKAWAKSLMQEAGIPTAKAAVFREVGAAKSYVKAQGAPIVVKADGLAAGKGVIVAQTVAEAQAAIEAIFQGQFGDAGQFVVIEEYLTGQELSVLALSDGLTIRPLLPAQDHKRIGEGRYRRKHWWDGSLRSSTDCHTCFNGKNSKRSFRKSDRHFKGERYRLSRCTLRWLNDYPRRRL